MRDIWREKLAKEARTIEKNLAHESDDAQKVYDLGVSFEELEGKNRINSRNLKRKNSDKKVIKRKSQVDLEREFVKRQEKLRLEGLTEKERFDEFKGLYKGAIPTFKLK